MEETKVLLELLTPETTSFGIKAQDWRTAVQKAGELLVHRGDIQKDYIDACIETAEEMGAYFVVRPEVALSHARPGQHVHRPR